MQTGTKKKRNLIMGTRHISLLMQKKLRPGRTRYSSANATDTTELEKLVDESNLPEG
jgi:hypothetical protein